MVDYYRYIKSPRWLGVKKRVINKRGWRCQLCGSEEDIQVHHLSYGNIGKEKDEDLLVLCETCHAKESRRPFVVELLKKRVGMEIV